MQRFLNIAVLSIAGTAAKSTYARHGLAPLLPSAARICIEDWNAGDGESELEIGAKAFYALAAQINIDDEQSFVIDIGTSNSKLMLQHFSDLELTREKIDFWVIPVRAGAKERIDTLKTISKLQAMEIDPKKIVVIAQAVTDVTQFDTEFGPLIESSKEYGFVFAKQAVLYNDVYNLLKSSDKSVFDIADNMPDFKSMREQHRGDEKKLIEIGNQMLIYSLAKTAAKNLLAVFQSTPMHAALSQ